MTTKYVAYYRVSTATARATQASASTAQRAAVAKHIAAADSMVAEFTEVESAARSTTAEQLGSRLSTGHRQEVPRPSLVIAKLDRLSRNDAAFHLWHCLSPAWPFVCRRHATTLTAPS
jgi:DNA invertase Pin-like site-specific DNA recombinase